MTAKAATVARTSAYFIFLSLLSLRGSKRYARLRSISFPIPGKQGEKMKYALLFLRLSPPAVTLRSGKQAWERTGAGHIAGDILRGDRRPAPRSASPKLPREPAGSPLPKLETEQTRRARASSPTTMRRNPERCRTASGNSAGTIAGKCSHRQPSMGKYRQAATATARSHRSAWLATDQHQ